MPCRANASSVNQVGLDAATISVLFFVTGGVSFCSGVDAPEVLDSEPKVTPPSLVYKPSDLTSLALRAILSTSPPSIPCAVVASGAPFISVRRARATTAKQALVVVAVKLLHAVYAMLKHRQPFNPSRLLVAPAIHT